MASQWSDSIHVIRIGHLDHKSQKCHNGLIDMMAGLSVVRYFERNSSFKGLDFNCSNIHSIYIIPLLTPY